MHFGQMAVLHTLRCTVRGLAPTLAAVSNEKPGEIISLGSLVRRCRCRSLLYALAS